MTAKRVAIFGVGQRVRGDFLPALAALPQSCELVAAYARQPRELEWSGPPVAIEAFDEFAPGALAGVDLVYLAVPKATVPVVLRRLAHEDLSAVDLLIETPVLLFKHLGHRRLLDRFRNAWAAEDCVRLPWLDAVGTALTAGAIGELETVEFHHAAWRYHGVAMLKHLFGARDLRSARRRRLPSGGDLVEYRFSGGRRGEAHEPRDYASGHIMLRGRTGEIGERAERAVLPLSLEVADGHCVGVRAGDHAVALATTERELMGPVSADATVTSAMEGAKRVALYRTLASICAGDGGYPVAEALDDMVVDFLLEKARRFHATPLTDVRSPLGRTLLSAATRLLARS
ncbi:MAG TPA: hypothetical protein QF764_00600 [Planctomycetota bacterium]|nr:hypothetical protein [Planctomycetota bacterium]